MRFSQVLVRAVGVLASGARCAFGVGMPRMTALASLVLGAVALSALPARADTFDLYPSSVTGGVNWTRESDVIGDPGCTSCACNTTTVPYAYNLNDTPDYLIVSGFENLPFTSGWTITSVNIDGMCRYESGVNDGIVRLQAFVGSTLVFNEQATFNSTTSCAYRYGASGNIPAPGGTWEVSEVNALDAQIRRIISGNTALRVRTIRVRVTAFPTDSDGDGTPDINDCAPQDQTIASPRTFYQDLDGDGFGNPNVATSLCQVAPPGGFVTNNTDCNDVNAGISPNTVWYRDEDRDGVGTSSVTQVACLQPPGFVITGGDVCPRIPNTDVNGNGVVDCVECTREEKTLWSNQVVPEFGWLNPDGAATNPTCGNVCDCNSTNGSYATSTGTGWLAATSFNGLTVPPGYVAAVVRVDAMVRSGLDQETVLRVDAQIGTSTLFVDQISLTSTDGNCRYVLDQPALVGGFLNLNSLGGVMNASQLDALEVRVRRVNGADLRVRTLRLYALLVPAAGIVDSDGDCVADSADNCPTIANGSQANADGDSLGDACDPCPNYPVQTDGNGNGIFDCNETAAQQEADYYASSVPNLPAASAWRFETVAAGNASCTSGCSCNTLGTYAYNGNVGEPGDVGGDTDYLVANFNINLPSNRIPIEVRVDVAARYDSGAEGTIRTDVLVDGLTGWDWARLADATNPANDTTCKYRYGEIGFIQTPPGGQWTRQHLQNLIVKVRRNTTAASNVLRVKGFKVRVKTIEVDSDFDGKVDSVDNCDFVANADQADCDGNGVGNACEAALFPLRDANDNGIVDACESGIAGWTGEAGDGNWNNPVNWSNRGVPGVATAVTIESAQVNGTVSITVPAGLTIASLTVDNGVRAVLTMAGAFATTGPCSIGNGAQLVLSGSGGERTFSVGGAVSVGQSGTLDLASSARIAVAQNFTCFAQSNILLTLRPVAVGTAPITIGGVATMNATISVRILGLAASQLVVGTKYPAVRFNGTIANGRTGNGFLVPNLAAGTFVKEEVSTALPPATLQFVVTNLAQFLALAGSNSTAIDGGPTAIVAGDFFPDATGPQSDDYVVTVRNAVPSLAGSIYSFKNNGNGTFQQLAIVTAMVDPIAIEKSDLDADGRKDVMVLGRSSRLLQAFTNTGSTAGFPFNGNGSTTAVGAPGDLPVDFAIAPTLAALDDSLLATTRGIVVVSQRVAGDGTFDAVQQAARMAGGVFLPAPANGATIVTNEPAGPIDPSPETRESAQFSARMFHSTLSEQAGGTSGTVRGLSVSSTGTLIENFASTGGLATPIDVETVDLDLDGFDDLVAVGDRVSAATGTDTRDYVLAVFRGTGAGSFDMNAPSVFEVDPTPDDGVVPLRPLDLTIGNFDGIGGPDIAVALGEILGAGQVGRHVRTFVNRTNTPPGGGVPQIELTTNAASVSNQGEGVLRIRAAQVIAAAVNEGFVKMGETVGGFGDESFFFGDGLLPGPFTGSTAFQPQTQPLCVDQNGDGQVDSLDLGIVLGAWGTLGYGPAQIGNVDLIGTVDAQDIAAIINGWGPCSPD